MLASLVLQIHCSFMQMSFNCREVLPFFLLIIDLSKACALANFALSSSNQQEVLDNVAKGVSIIGPAMTLDTVAEVLVIGVGTLSGSQSFYFSCYMILITRLQFIYSMYSEACLDMCISIVKHVWICVYLLYKLTMTAHFHQGNKK